MTQQVWIGTRKGAFVFTSKDRKKWASEGPFFCGQEVHHVAQDPRDPGRLYAAVGNAWFGYHLNASTDGGKTWKVSENGLTMAGEKTSLNRIWHICAGASDDPGVVWLGADPGALFRSPDNGENWEVVK